MSGMFIGVGIRISTAIFAAFFVCAVWSGAAFAQDTPFDSQYGAPPTSPPTTDGCTDSGEDPGSGDDPSATAASGCDGAGLIKDGGEDIEVGGDPDGASIVELLPTTGGLPLAPVLLAGSLIVGAGIFAARRRR